MGEGLSHWSNMVLRKSQTYFFDRHTHPNSMSSNFCHVLNSFFLIDTQLQKKDESYWDFFLKKFVFFFCRYGNGWLTS